MSVSSPPAAQSARNENSFGTLAAAIGGVLKMPMPTTVPTSMALAWRTDNVGKVCADAWAASARALAPPARCTARCEPDCETGALWGEGTFKSEASLASLRLRSPARQFGLRSA